MRPRLRPRSAFVVAVPCAITLGAAIVLNHAAPSEKLSAAHIPIIDATLTRDLEGCARVQSALWHPLSGLEYTGRLHVTLPAFLGGAIVFFIGDEMRLDVEAVLSDGTPVLMHRERVAVLAPDVPPDYWLDAGTPWRAPRVITRVLVDSPGEHDLEFTLALGRRAPRVLARLIGYPADVRAPVCAGAVSQDQPYFATGWYGRETTPDGVPLRWMRDRGVLMLASRTTSEARVQIRAAPAVASIVDHPTWLTLRVNNMYETAPVTMAAGFADYEWRVPAHAWLAGVNELLFTVSRTEVRGTRTLGLALASLHAQ